MSDYETIKAQCLKKDEFWEDPDFKAEQTSIYYRKEKWMPDWSKVVWKRPAEICFCPQFIIEGMTKFDVDQGEIGEKAREGSTWFLSALSVLATKPELMDYVVPPEQSFIKEYAGIFRFNFWIYGRWEEVLVDDRLPTLDGKLVFCQNKEQQREFWTALLEKAYAKVHGSYQALNVGNSHDVLVDFTGGIGENISLTNNKDNTDHLFKVIKHIFEMNSLLCCDTGMKENDKKEQTLENGLVSAHTYSITSVVEFENEDKLVRLVRLLNPWGKQEWNGDWADGAKEWRSIPLKTMQLYDLETRNEGEFWMSFDDFLENYNQIQICHLTPESIMTGKTEWCMTTYHGHWIPGVNAGGRGVTPDEDKYWSNPQFFVTLRDADRLDGLDKCSLVVSLINKNNQTENKASENPDETIGFDILKFKSYVPEDLEFQQFDSSQLELVVKMEDFEPKRERSERYELDPGTYCIMPLTYHPDTEAEFLLRIASEEH